MEKNHTLETEKLGGRGRGDKKKKILMSICLSFVFLSWLAYVYSTGARRSFFLSLFFLRET